LIHVQIITVQDTTPPDAVCQDITIELDKFGLVSILPTDIDGGSTDNCAPPEVLDFQASQVDFDCSHLGPNTVVLTVTDPCGNASTCTAIVTVVEGIAPCVPEYDVEGSQQCICLNNATTLSNGQFEEVFQILSLGGQTWTLASSTGLYSVNSPAPPAIPIAIGNGMTLTPGNLDGIDNDDDGQTDEEDECRFYTLRARHVDGQGYVANFVNNLGETIQVQNTCYYPTPYFANLDDPFCLNTPPFQVEVEELNGATGTVTIYINGVQTDIFDAGALGEGTYLIEAIFDAGMATSHLLVDGVAVNGTTLQDALLDPGCEQPIEQYVSVVGTPDVVACNDLVQVSLEEDCESVIDPDMVLEGSYYCYDDYSVILSYPLGTNTYNPPNTVDGSHVGYTIGYTLHHIESGNLCWGEITVEDKLDPVIECPEAATLLCTEDPDWTDAFGNLLTGEPTVDDCSSWNREYSDEYVQYDCAENSLVKTHITRTFIVTDASGNTAQCVQEIEILRGQLAHVTKPGDVEYYCNATPGSFSPDETGWPQIAGVDITDQGSGACGLGVSYSDATVNTCPGEYKIVRTWTVYDWCPPQGGDPVSMTHVQYIKILDVAPSITLPAFLYDPVNDWYVISANGYNNDPHDACVALGPIPTATVDGVCNNVVSVFVATPVGNTTNGGWLPDPGLPQGAHQVTYTAEDQCGNITSLTVTLYVVDDIAPTAICDEITEVDLTSDGMAIVNASVFDDGTYDNCCLDELLVRRMDGDCEGNYDDFDPTVKFCCTDAGTTVMVVFRAVDCEGNYNECMVQVEVEDKLPPFTTFCPAPATITCDEYLEDYAAGLANGNNSVLDGFGTATFYDNCELDVTYQVTVNINTCQEGTITRTWTADDGPTNPNASCTQVITVQHVSDWVVEFPANITAQCVDGQLPEFGEPAIFFDECELIGVSYEDTYFYVVPDACYKIVRTWTVINWCVYEDYGTDVWEEDGHAEANLFMDWDGDGDFDTRTFRDGWNASGNPGTPDGYIDYDQVIKVVDEEAPIFDVADQEVCIEETDCDTNVTLPTPDVTDCSTGVEITVTSNLPNPT
ncbi:MAG: hypothetical protein KDC32_24905, partial [Saprospiraceae bacterium]|nr:hypothetical protein [Saprospiraceae bacterium]